MSGVFITVAPTGAESSHADNPALPLQPDQIIRQAIESEAAGASLVHIHGRDTSGKSSLDPAVLTEIMAGIRESTDLIIQLSTGGGVHDSFEDRLAVVGLKPDSCSLTCGTVNFGRDVFSNPLPLVEELYGLMLEHQVMPEFECFDLGHVETVHRLLEKFGPPTHGRIHCNLVMGVPGGMPGTPQSLMAARSALPEDASWSATGIGRTTIPVMLTALALGGNLRVGMEDTLTFAPGSPVDGNAQLVYRAVELCGLAQLTVSTPQEAREFLHLAS